MKRKYIHKFIVALIFLVSVVSFSQTTPAIQVVKKDTIKTNLKYNFKHNQNGSLFLKNPSEVEIT